MALVTLDGRWLEVNRSLCETVGYSEQELLEKTFQDITHPDDLEADLAYVQRLLAGEIDHYHMEKRYFHKDGYVVWVLLSASLARDAQGAPLHFVAQVQDITARRHAEERLRRSTTLVELLQAVAVAANEAPDAEEAMRTALELVWGHTGWPVGHVYLVASSGDGSDVEVVSTDIWHLEDPERFRPFTEATEGTRFPTGVDLPGRVLATKRSAWIENVAEDPAFHRAQWARNAGITSGIAFPALMGEEVVAVLEFFSTEI